MAFFTCLLLLILLTTPFVLLFRGRRFEELVPAALIFAVLTLYLFGMFHALRAGSYTLIALAAGAGAYFLYRVIFRRDRDALRRFLSPGLAAYAVMGIAAFLITSGLTAMVDNDSFDHWALVVKNMYLLNALGNAEGSTVAFQSYPPGVSLLQTWLMLLGGAYRQGLNYAGVALLSVTVTAPVLRALEWKRPLHAVVITLLLFLYPIVIFNSNYATLQVDSLIGMLGALMLFVYFKNRGKNREDEAYVCMMLALTGTMLSLSKVFGTVLLGICGCIILADVLFNRRAALVETYGAKKVTRAVIFTALGALFGCVSWAVYMALTPVNTIAQTAGGAMSGLRELLASPATYFSGYRGEVLFRFVNELLSGVGYRFIQFAYAGWMLLLIVPWLVLCLKGSKELRRSRATLAIGLLVGFFVYAGLLLASYLFTFEPDRAVMLGSFQRYLFTYFQLAFGAAFFVFLSWDELKKTTPVLLISACLILPFVPVRDMTSMAVQGGELAEAERPLTHTQLMYETLDADEVLVGYISANQAYSYWGTRYYATPVHFEFYDLDALLADLGGADDGEIMQRLLADLSADGCTHLYVRQSSARISALLASADPELAGSGDDALFTIERQDGGYGLVPCAYHDPNRS